MQYQKTKSLRSTYSWIDNKNKVRENKCNTYKLLLELNVLALVDHRGEYILMVSDDTMINFS